MMIMQIMAMIIDDYEDLGDDYLFWSSILVGNSHLSLPTKPFWWNRHPTKRRNHSLIWR